MTRRNPHDLAAAALTNATVVATLVTQAHHRLETAEVAG